MNECLTHHPTPVDTLQVTDQSQLGLGKVELHANHNPNKQMLGAEWTGKQSITVNRPGQFHMLHQVTLRS
jgi:hypothetical protein